MIALISRKAKDDDSFLFVTGPGHGAPIILSQLFIDGSISYFDDRYDNTTKAGVDAFVKAFSWPGGFPSHVNAETPGGDSLCPLPILVNN